MTVTREVKYAPSPKVDPANPNIKRWDNGLILHENFITPEDEAAAISAIEADTRWTGIGKRQTLQFGHHFDYTTFGASETNTTPMPSYLADLLDRLPLISENVRNDVGETEKLAFTPDQFTVQYYPPGTGIPPHVDTHSAFREALYSLSMGSTVPMAFKKCGKTEARRMRKPKRSLFGDLGDATQNLGNGIAARPSSPIRHISSLNGPGIVHNDLSTAQPKTELDTVDEKATHGLNLDDIEEEEPWELFLPPRSLLIMTGPSRYGFTHKIRGRKFDRWKDGSVVERKPRYSITMRK